MSAAVRLVKVTGPACVQDLGRPGQLALGLPRGGTLAPRRLRTMNAALGNSAEAAALEVFGVVTFEVTRAAYVTVDGDAPFRAEPGVEHRVAVEGRRVRLVAFEGGLAVPEVLGGRGLLPSARIGGHEGRWLRSGDVLLLGDSARAGAPLPMRQGEPRAVPHAPHEDLVVRVHVGPDHHVLVVPASLAHARFRVAATSDRTGLRLEGDAVPFHPRPRATPSIPLVPGAVQLPPHGLPVVLGPDHPVTGGYPVVGVVAAADLEELFVAPLGSVVRFVGS
jgi:5-oxoprolinase (ATP-hydrolysing) subunit C